MFPIIAFQHFSISALQQGPMASLLYPARHREKRYEMLPTAGQNQREQLPNRSETLKCLYTVVHEAHKEDLMENRIDYFERMLADNPDNPTGLLALANEYQKAGREEDEAAVLQRYLTVQADDEGNAYARLGHVLSNLGRKEEARTAYEKGVAQSEKHGHSGMADDLRLALIQLNE
jgi:tetratricopeptide (TPR) repeat protein